MHPVPGSPARVYAARQSSCAYRKLTNTGTPARWPAGGSSAQRFQHPAQQRGIYLSANAQPLPAHQHQLTLRFRCVLPRRSCLHQREPRWLLSPEPFAPNVERLLGDALFLAKLLHGPSAALLLGDMLVPIRTSLLNRLTGAASCHVTNMRPPGRLWKRGSRAAYLFLRGPRLTFPQVTSGTPPSCRNDSSCIRSSVPISHNLVPVDLVADGLQLLP